MRVARPLSGMQHRIDNRFLIQCLLAQASTRKSKVEVPDIDAADRDDPLACTEYVNDIYSYWRRVEVRISGDT